MKRENCLTDIPFYCGKIISFIYKKTVIKKILDHLGEYEENKNQRAPPAAAPDYTEPEVVSYDDGWPEHDEAV